MIDLEELAELNPIDLALLLTDRVPTWTAEPAVRWRAVLELFTSRLASSDRRVTPEEVAQLRAAYEALVAGASGAGALDGRESVLRRVNMLVALARSAADPAIDDLAAAARRTVLESLPLSIESARVKASNWRALPADEVRDLRYAKNLLGPLRSIAGDGRRPDDSADLDAWLQLLPSLP
ncbi:hypothetical protein [Dactylosporangium sp. NPDC051541]|uniref:hypothetical protein n=1 Tax=Dactylosporangium sp. NPDC051541 TaxID=3363977 RepID=UPI0037A3B129